MTTYQMCTYEVSGGPVGSPKTHGWIASITTDTGMVVSSSNQQPTEQAAIDELRTRAAVVGIEVH